MGRQPEIIHYNISNMLLVHLFINVSQPSQLLLFCLLFGLCSSNHSERWRTSSNTRCIDEKRRLLNLRKEETEILNNKNNEEADETQSESKIERFVRLLLDEDELESVTENEE